MDTVWVFQSLAFNHATLGPAPAGKDCAQYVADLLARNGLAVQYSGPIQGDFGWFVYLIKDGKEYELNVQWAAANGRPGTFWCARLRAMKSLLGRLLWQNVDKPALETMIDLITQLLSADQQNGTIQALVVLSENEFWTSYAC